MSQHGISSREIGSISQFLASNQLVEEAIKEGKAIHYSSKKTGLARGLVATPEGEIYLIFNSRRKGDKIIGDGSQKIAKLGISLISSTFVARISDKGTSGPDALKREYALSCEASSDAIFQPLPNSYGSYAKTTREGEFFLMPLCNTDLKVYSLSDATSEEEWEEILFQMISSTAALHQNGILHRDIKPANFFKLDDIVRLADLGIAAKEEDLDEKKKRYGSLMYTAPELAKANTPEEIAQATTRQSDGWQLGVSILEKFSSKLPYLKEHWEKIEEVNRINAWLPFAYSLRRLPDSWLGTPLRQMKSIRFF